MEGPGIVRISALIADPARSLMLLALMDGRALTATELSTVASITKQTASSHLAKLVDGGVLTVEAQGRHRYYRLTGSHVADLLEALMVFSNDGAPLLHTGPKEPALRKARICYDHLAGEMGVMLYDRMLENNWITANMTVTSQGWDHFAKIGLTPHDSPHSRRPLCRACMDWSVRRHHLAGRIGKLLLDRLFTMSWAYRLPNSRIVNFTLDGEKHFLQWLE